MTLIDEVCIDAEAGADSSDDDDDNSCQWHWLMQCLLMQIAQLIMMADCIADIVEFKGDNSAGIDQMQMRLNAGMVTQLIFLGWNWKQIA